MIAILENILLSKNCCADLASTCRLGNTHGNVPTDIVRYIAHSEMLISSGDEAEWGKYLFVEVWLSAQL